MPNAILFSNAVFDYKPAEACVVALKLPEVYVIANIQEIFKAFWEQGTRRTESPTMIQLGMIDS
jgi:protein-disulfide isomerase-like protein with CxxC motif